MVYCVLIKDKKTAFNIATKAVQNHPNGGYVEEIFKSTPKPTRIN